MTNPTSALSPQNGFSTTLSAPMTTTDTTVYLTTLPTATEGYLTLDEGLTTQEVLFYNSKGSNFVTVPSLADRGLQGSTTGASAHASGAVVKMKTVAQYIQALASGYSFATSLISATHLSPSAITLGYAEVSASQASITAAVDLTGLTTTVTVPSNSRKVRISFYIAMNNNTGSTWTSINLLKDGSAYAGEFRIPSSTAGAYYGAHFAAVDAPSAGSHTYKLQGVTNSGTATLTATATNKNWILVEAI